MISNEEIERIRARADAATEGPWSRVMALGSRWWTLGRVRDHQASPLTADADWDFAEAARTDVPRLCDELLSARKRIAELEIQSGSNDIDARRDVARIEELEDALQLILPMAKGYLSTHQCGSNKAYLDQAESALSGEGEDGK
jgi:hypothetical protein